MCKNQQWIQDVLSGRDTRAVPFNFSFSPPARQLVENHYKGSPVEEILDFPIRMTGLKTIKPLYADPDEYGDTIKDEYGVVWSTSKIDRGSPLKPCLTEPDLSGYIFPESCATYRFQDISDWCDRNRDHYRIIWIGDLWERATFMRGMEDILMDLVLNPGFIEKLLRGIADYILKTMQILFDRFEFEGIALSDDYGTQQSLIMSPELWRKFIKPLLDDIYGFAKKHNRTVFHHSCGNIYPVIGDMIDCGLDILHPIQPEAMDVFELKQEFGAHLTLCGGIRTQDLLPRGTVQEVRHEVTKLKQEMGKGGRYILEPGITLQADVPLDNLIAMIDEARSGNS